MALKDLITAVKHDHVYKKETLLSTLREFQDAKNQLVYLRHSLDEIRIAHSCPKNTRGANAPCDVCAEITRAIASYTPGFVDVGDDT